MSEEEGERGFLDEWGRLGSGGNWVGRRKRESVMFVFIRPAALTTHFFPRIALFFCIAALELARGLG